MRLSELQEFINIFNSEKFNKNSMVTFKNGEPTGLWFEKHKQEIYEDDNKECCLIQRQHQFYLTNKTSTKRPTNSIKPSPSTLAAFLSLCHQFANITDVNKFNPDYMGVFENAGRISTWFLDNKTIIFMFADEYECCTQVKKQYEKYENAKRVRAHRQFLKDKLSFLNLETPVKFSYYSFITLPSGTPSGVWFERNKDALLKDEKIRTQYVNYRIYDSLREEFYNEPNHNKFNSLSNVRFADGALMSSWWEANQEAILKKEDRRNRQIFFQYAEFIAAVDDENKDISDGLNYKDSQDKVGVYAKKA